MTDTDEATIQRLIAQQDGSAKEIERLQGMIDAALGLHQRSEMLARLTSQSVRPYCVKCSSSAAIAIWPCATAYALGVTE